MMKMNCSSLLPMASLLSIVAAGCGFVNGNEASVLETENLGVVELGLGGSRKITVKSTSELRNALNQLRAGDTIILRKGIYSDVRVRLEGRGSDVAPIVVAGESAGQVVFKGNSSVSMRGQNLVLQNIVFTEGSASESVVAIGEEGFPCNSCKVSNIRIEKYSAANFWVTFVGKNSILMRSTLVGKSTKGPIVAVIRNNDSANRHQIVENEFLDQPKGSGNGYEVIRIGTGAHASSDSFTTIERNLFDSCLGETEIISNKSGSNVIRLNTLRSNGGGITLRNGNGALVEGNYVLGNSVEGSYGIRITGKRNVVVGNHIEATKHSHGGISLVAGHSIINAVGDEAQYHNAESNTVAFNSVVDSASSGVLVGNTQGNSGPFQKAKDNTVRNNILLTLPGGKPISVGEAAVNNITDNIGNELGAGVMVGVKNETVNVAAQNGVRLPANREHIRVANAFAETINSRPNADSLMGKTVYETHSPLNRGQVGQMFQAATFTPAAERVASSALGSPKRPDGAKSVVTPKPEPKKDDKKKDDKKKDDKKKDDKKKDDKKK
jgi:poly(beta-D-mannuronate) lyase